MSGGRLPNGKHTTSDRVYVREWRRFGKAICKVLDESSDAAPFICTAFDPGVQVMSRSKKFGRCYDTWDATLLATIGGWTP